MFFYKHNGKWVSKHHSCLLWLQEVTQKSLAQGSAERTHVSGTPPRLQSQSAAHSLFQVPCQGPIGATPSKALPSPRYLVGKELLQSLPAQPSCLELLAGLIRCLPFHQGLSLSKEVGQKDLSGRNKHKLTCA